MRTSRYLWISNLPPNVTEEEIRESLISHGKIHNVKIHEVADSKGAVVAFFDQTGATKAIESSNKLDGVVLKIEYCDLHGAPGLQRLQQQQNQLAQQQNCDKTPDWIDERGSRAKSPLDSHRNRSRSSSLSSTRSGRSNLTDASKHGGSSRRERNYHKSSVDHVRRKYEKGDRERDRDENSQESGGESPLSRFGEMRGLKVSQLPQRSSDSNIKEGLFHDLKRFGKITSVEIKGDDPSNRCAIVTFKRAEDAEKAYMKWNDKVYFFTNVVVERHPGTDKEDPSFCQPEQVLNEFHPKSTKTLFVGNLHHEPDSPKAKQELIDTFEEFGSILEIDIKKQPNQNGVAYAFIQYADINSVVRALHKAESIKIAGKPVKLGFGKSQPTQCLWLSNLPSGTTDGFLANHFKRYGPVKYIKLHPQQLRALVYFENVDSAQKALSEQKNRIIAGRKLQADYASQRCQRHLLDQILQLNSFHMRSHPIADALRLAYSHAYMKSSYYHHYIRNFARYEDRSRSRHMEDMDLYDPYVEAGRRGSGSNDYDAFLQRRSGGSSAVGGSGSGYPESGASGFGESGSSRNSISGGSGSVKKCSDRNCVKTNGPSCEAHYSRNRSDSPFSSKSSHSRDFRSRSRSPRIDRKHRDSTNRSHNRSDSSHSGEGEASADSSCQRVMRHRRSITRGSHSLSAGVGSDSIAATRSSAQSSSTCVRREHRGPSSASTRIRIQRLKSEVKPAASTSSSSGRPSSRRIDNPSDDDGDSDVEAAGASAPGASVSAIASGHSGTGDSSSIHSGGSGGHRSDDATDIGELMAQREKLLREIFEMDGDASGSLASTISVSSVRTVTPENHRSKPLLRDVVEPTHHDKLKASQQELHLPTDSRKSREKSTEDDSLLINRTVAGNDEDHECKDASVKRRHADCAIPSRLSNGPLSKSVSVTVPPLSAGFPSETSRSPGKAKSDDNALKLISPKVEETGPSFEVRVPSTPTSGAGSSTNQFHSKVHSLSQQHPNQRILQHSAKSDQCLSSTSDGVSSYSSERKLVSSAVTSVNASRDPRLAPQQYGNRLVGGNIPQALKHSSHPTPNIASTSSGPHHETTTERLTDLLQRFVQPVTAMAPTIAGHMEVNASSNDTCSPPPPPPPPPPLPHHQPRGMVPPIDPQHSLPKGSTSEKQSLFHDDASTLADCEDPELKSVMQKTSTIDKQIQELDMKISRSEIARATAPTIDLSKYRIRPRSDVSKSAVAAAKPAVGTPTPTEGCGPAYTSTKPNEEKEESSVSAGVEMCEPSTVTGSAIKSQDTSEFVKSMLMQSSRTSNSSFFIPTPTCSSATTTTPSVSSPPVSASATANAASSWTSPSACDDALRSVTASSTSSSLTNRLSSPPIVVSNVTNPTFLNKIQPTSTTPPVTSHPIASVCVVSSHGSGLSTSASPVTVNSTNSSNRPPRLSSVSCSVDSNSDTASIPSASHDITVREPRSPEHLKSILKKETPEAKIANIRTSPTTPKSAFPDNCTLSVKTSVPAPLLNVSSSNGGQKPQRSPIGPTTKAALSGNDAKPTTSLNVKRKHSDEIKKPYKVLKLEVDSESNLFRPDSFLFANKSDVKKEKRSIDQAKRPLQISAPEIVTSPVTRAEISPLTDMKASPQLSNSSHDEFKGRKEEADEKNQRKFSVDDVTGKKRKTKDKSLESSDTGSKPDDSDDENKQDSSKRKRKKKLNRSKDDLQRLNKKGKRKKKKKLDQNQILKKKTREKLKETEDKLKKLKQRKQRSADGKDSCDLSDSIERQPKKEKQKEKVDRKCSNDDSFSEDDWNKTSVFKEELSNATMYDFVKMRRKQFALKNQGHSKDHKRDAKSARRKSTENFKKSNDLFDSADNSVDESESRASSSKSITRKSKGKSSKNKRRRQIMQLTSDDSDDREDTSNLLSKLVPTPKASNRFRMNSDEADDETDFEERRKITGKSGKKKPEKRKTVDLQSVSSKKSKKPKLSSDMKKKCYTEECVMKKRRKKSSSSNNKLDTNDSGKQKMSVASVFSDVDTDSSTGTESRLRFPVKMAPNEETDDSQASEDGLPMPTPPKSRLVRPRTAASSPTTPSTEPMSDDAVMNDLSLSGLTPFREKNKNPLKEALTSAHEESRKELKELQRESNLMSDRRAIVDDEDVEVSEDLPSLEVMTGIVKSPSFIDDEPPPITCDDAPTLTTDAEADDGASVVEETVIEEHCVDVPIVDDAASDKCPSSIDDSNGASRTSRTSSSAEEQSNNIEICTKFEDYLPGVDMECAPLKLRDDSSVSSTYEITRTDVNQTIVSEIENDYDVQSSLLKPITPDTIKELKVKLEIDDDDINKTDASDGIGNETKSTTDWNAKGQAQIFSSCALSKVDSEKVEIINQPKSDSPITIASNMSVAVAPVYPVEQSKISPPADAPVLELPVKTVGPTDISKSEADENTDVTKTSNDTGNKVEMVRYVQRIMERVSVDISEDNKGSGKRIKKGSSGLSCPTGSSHPNQNILSSIADRGLSDRKPISSTNTACLLPPGCNIYLEDSKMLPNLPASVTLSAPILNPTSQPQHPVSKHGQPTPNSTPVTVISSCLKGVAPITANTLNRVGGHPGHPPVSSSGSMINATLTVAKPSLTVSGPNFNSSLDGGRMCNSVSQEAPAQLSQATAAISGTVPLSDVSMSERVKVSSSNTVMESNANAVTTNYPSTRRVFTRRKRNSSSNANSKASNESERDGSWHAHVDEVLEKVVHGKSQSPNPELSKAAQPANHLTIKIEDQLLQQKETDEAVRAIEMSMIRGGSTDSTEGNTTDIPIVKKDVDPYEPNFDEPSPSEINRNILTHSHHKRQDGINVITNPNESEEARGNTNSTRPVFETLLNEIPDKLSVQQSQTGCSKIASDVPKPELDTSQNIKQNDENQSTFEDEKVDDEKMKEDKSNEKVEKPGENKDKRSDENNSGLVPTIKVELSHSSLRNSIDCSAANSKISTNDGEPESSDLKVTTKTESRSEDQKLEAMKHEQPTEVKTDLQQIAKVVEPNERQKLEQHHKTPPQAKPQPPTVHHPHQAIPASIPQIQVTQFSLQKQQVNPLQAQSNLTQPQLTSQQLQQSILIHQQQPAQAHLQPQMHNQTPQQAHQLHQLQQLQSLQQQPLKFPHLLQQKCVTATTKHVDSLDSIPYRLIPTSKVSEALSSVTDTITTSDAVVVTKETAPPISSSVSSVTTATGTRKRTNRAMSQTALIHVDEILDAVAHDKNFDLTQYSKDHRTDSVSVSRRRSNSGEDHFPQPNALVQSALKDNPGLFATTDLRVLTPRSANAMVSCKVGAEEQVQVQATLAQPQQASGPSKVSIAPHVLEQFLKHGNPTLTSQQFQQARPASAVGVNDASNLSNASLIAAVEPGFPKLALATSFASLSPGASISPALASTGISSKTLAALATPLQPIETAKIVHPSNTTSASRHTSLPQPSVTPTSTTNPQSCSQPFAVAQATATVEDRGHAIERIPNPGLAAVQQHHRDQISPRLAVVSSASPAATNVPMDSKTGSSANSLLNPVSGIVKSVSNRPASNPVHLQANTLSDSAQTSHQTRNFLPSGLTFDPNYDYQIQAMQAAMQQLMRQSTGHFNAAEGGNLLENIIASWHLAGAAGAAGPSHQFWPNNEQRRDGHASVANTIISGVPVQGIPTTTLTGKQNIGPSPEWSQEQLLMLQAKYHMSWKGKLALKNDEVLVQMLFITGNVVLVNNCITMIAGALGGTTPAQHALKIVQRMRMEQSQLEGVVRKMEEDHCMLLALPTGEGIDEMEHQASILSNSFIKYLQEKTAAGIINVNHAESQQPAYVVHIFPPGEFSRQRLSSCSSEIINACGELPHLLVIITTV